MKQVSLTIPPAKLGPSLFGAEMDDVFADLDQAFEQIQVTSKKKEAPKDKRRRKAVEKDIAMMQSTFVEISKVHLRPVLRYLKAIQLGVASKDLCEIVHYVVGPVIGKTRKVGLVEQTKALIGFQRELKSVVKGRGRVLTQEQREKLASSFDVVQKSFELEFRGHSAAVVNLLGFYRALKKNKSITEADMKKVFAIGIPSLTMLRKSSIEELVSLSGVTADKMTMFRLEARKFNILSML